MILFCFSWPFRWADERDIETSVLEPIFVPHEYKCYFLKLSSQDYEYSKYEFEVMNKGTLPMRRSDV